LKKHLPLVYDEGYKVTRLPAVPADQAREQWRLDDFRGPSLKFVAVYNGAWEQFENGARRHPEDAAWDSWEADTDSISEAA
jgi:hypothetical protein